MRIHRLRPGQRAPEHADFVHLHRFDDGWCGWTGWIGSGDDRVAGANRDGHRSISAATNDAINWARAMRSDDLYIVTDDA